MIMDMLGKRVYLTTPNRDDITIELLWLKRCLILENNKVVEILLNYQHNILKTISKVSFFLF